MKLLVISWLLAFHGAVCNVISCALQGMSQLVLRRGLLRHSASRVREEEAAPALIVQSIKGGGWEL